MEDFIFPKTFDEWRHTITVKGGIELTPSYVSERIAILKNEKDSSTQNFIKLYGKEYHQQVTSWFEQEQMANG